MISNCSNSLERIFAWFFFSVLRFIVNIVFYMVVQSSRCPMRPLNWSINWLQLLFRRAMWPTSLLFCLKDAWIFSKDTPPGMQVFYKTPCYWLPLIFFFLTNCVSISARNIQCMYTAIWRTSLSYLDLNLTEIIWINLAYVYVGWSMS